MTEQEIFTKVKDHLLVQMKQSVTRSRFEIDEYRCKYRGPNGLKCAIGCLIPDGLYKPSMEGLSVKDLIYNNINGFGHYLGIEYGTEADRMLYSLQHCHDTYAPAEWAGRLREIHHGLEY